MDKKKHYKKVFKKVLRSKFAFRYFQRFWWELDSIGGEIICYQPSYLGNFKKIELHRRVTLLDHRIETLRGSAQINFLWRKFIRDKIRIKNFDSPALVIGVGTNSSFLSSRELARLPLLKFFLGSEEADKLPNYND